MSTSWIDSLHIKAPAQLKPWPCVELGPKKTLISHVLQHLDWHTVYTIEDDQQHLETLVKERPFLMAHYRIQAAHLVQLGNKLDKYDPKLAQEAEKALKITVLLKKIYMHLDEPDDVMRANIDISILNKILYRIQHSPLKHPSNIPQCKVGFSHQLRALHVNTNLSRLATIRIRRFILTCAALQTFTTWRPTVSGIEVYTAPFFLYLGWIFFLPRLLLNLTTLFKKWFFTQSRLPWHLRLEAYLNLHRRLHELWTDTVWFTSGVLLCFVLFGPLSVWRPLATIVVQVSDVIMMMTRSFFELRRLSILKNEYIDSIKNKLSQKNPTYLQALEERIAFEKKVSYLAITNNLLMVFALLTLLPSAAALHPLLPALGAALGILTTLRFYVHNKANESQQPRTNLNLLLKNYEPVMSHHFFKPEPTTGKLPERQQSIESFSNTPQTVAPQTLFRRNA